MAEDDEPVLDQINLVVADVGRSAEFYRLLGVPIQDAPDPWDRHHRSATTPGGLALDLDSQRFASEWNTGWPNGRTGAVVGFRLSDRTAVDEAYRRLTDAGYTGQQPPYDAFWGSRYAIVEDPDGNAVGLMSPPDPALRSRPEPPRD